MTDGMASIQQRIATIQRQMDALAGKTTTSTAGSSNTSTTSSSSSTDFASLLQEATAPTSTSQVTDVDLSKYANGKIPESALMSIGGGEKLAAPAGKAFLEMKAAAAKAGVTLGVNDSYRSYDEQVAMAKEKGLYSQGGKAAVPGTSDHGRGIALDLQLDAKAQTWMKNNAKQYGFINNVSGESWHWTYKPS